MKLSPSKFAAGCALALTLCGCASTDTLKTKGLLSAAQGKDPMKALNGSSGTVSLPDAVAVQATLHQAEDLRKTGDFQGAAKLLSQLVLESPDDAAVLGEYSKTLVGLGRSEDALAFVQRAIDLQPGDWSLYSARGVALDQKGDYRNAQSAYDRALELKPGDPTVLSNAALSHMQAGDLAGAEKLLLAAEQAGGDYPRIASNLALVRSLRGAGTPTAAAQASVTQSPPPGMATASAARLSSSPPARAPIIEAKPAAPAVAHTLRAGPPSVASGTSAAIAPSSVTKLKSDPAVRMQAVPKDPKAGAVVAKKVPAKDAAPEAALAALVLRPALSEGRPVQPASAAMRPSE